MKIFLISVILFFGFGMFQLGLFDMILNLGLFIDMMLSVLGLIIGMFFGMNDFLKFNMFL